MQDQYNLIRDRLNGVFKEIFDDDSIEIYEGMTAADIDEWDSLMHITLIVAIEEEFNIHFSSHEIGGLDNVGAMIKLLMGKTKN